VLATPALRVVGEKSRYRLWVLKKSVIGSKLFAAIIAAIEFSLHFS
jgi:hypothetical protein